MIELRGVSKTVPSGTGSLTILHPIDLTIEAGRVVAITGPSGSGKSTLLGLLAGLDAPSAGHVVLDGIDITTLGEDALAQLRGTRIGFVFQFFHLLPSLTAFENVLVPMEIAGLPKPAARAKELLEEVGLSDRGHHYPSQLSGGEQQRVAIARALANNPPILLADEPTGNLDSATGQSVIQLLLDVNRTRRTTLVLVTHDQELAAVADVVVALRDGRIVRTTTRTAAGGGLVTFVLKMLARELRSSWRRLLFFFVCVAVGVGAIVAIRSVIQSVRTGLMSEARSIIASDVLISTNRPWTSEVLSALGQRLATDEVLDRMEAIETATMVRAEGGADAARMVELRGVQPKFPFYGRVVLQDGQTFSHDLLRGRGALVRPELLTQLGTKVGGQLIIGGQPFTIRGVIAQEPGRRVGAFSFGSRVLIDYDDLRATGLLAFGSRASYQILLRVREQAVEPMTRDIRRDFRDRFVQARSYRSTEDDIGEDLMRAENYLSLVGFVMVVLGGIGVWSVTRVFVKQKIRSVAILKCVGATANQILATYVAQVLLLGIGGSLLGVGIAAVAIAAIPASAAAAFGNVSYGLTLSAALQGLAVGLLVSLLFSLVPLLEVRRVKPLLLLRSLDTVSAAAGREAVVARRRWCRRGCAARIPCQIARRRHRHRRARRAGRLAGRIHHRRAGRLRRLCGNRARPAWRRGAPRARRPAARRHAVFPAAPCGRNPAAARQPDPRHPPRGRPRQLLRARRAGPAGEPARAVLRPAAARRRGHVPDRHPAGSGRRGADASSATRASASRS